MLAPELFALAICASVALTVWLLVESDDRERDAIWAVFVLVVPVLSWPFAVTHLHQCRAYRAERARIAEDLRRAIDHKATVDFWTDKITNGSPLEQQLAEQLLTLAAESSPPAKPVSAESLDWRQQRLLDKVLRYAAEHAEEPRNDHPGRTTT